VPENEAPLSSHDLPIDFAIPGYEIIDKVWDGSMSTVFKARQLSVDRVVAIKVLRDNLAQDREHLRRFWCETLNAAKLSHPNIVTTIDAGEVDGHPFLIMEYIEGKSVQEHLDRGRIFAEPAAIEVALAVAEALRHDRGRGLIHRDIKPANVILAPDGGIKLVDLGLARSTEDDDWALAEAGMAVGTPEYISPEQVRGQVDVDIRSDLYSLGATLYHMVTGRVPYGGLTPREAMRRHVDPDTPLIPPDAINADLTRGLGAVIEKLMSRGRDDRYRHPDDLILDLRCLRRGGRPLIAEPTLDALAPLAVGDMAPDAPGHRAGSTVAAGDASNPARTGDLPTTWALLIVLPALLLVLALLGTVVLLIGG
jgi:serine/threonine protein kinase